jgi:hypothetical protein
MADKPPKWTTQSVLSGDRFCFFTMVLVKIGIVATIFDTGGQEFLDDVEDMAIRLGYE